MDALIFSCGTGGGHNSAANAVKQELLRRGHRVTMLDPYSLSNTRVGSLINQSYINLVKKAPRLFGLVYQLGNLYRRLPVHSPVYHINHRMALPVQRFLEEGNFDLIIMPHIFPGEILTNMRDHGICLPPTLLIATDYTCIPFTEEVQCDRYVIPSDDLCPAFTRWGIPKERLYPLGIPVDQSFENPPDKQESLRRLGLDPSLRYLLVVGGSIRSAADVVKAVALGADACYIGTAALLALGCHLCRSCHTGRCNWGIATQNPELVKRLDPDVGAERLVNLVTAWKREIKEMMGGMGINSIEALRGNRLMLRGVGLNEKELSILGVRHAGE